MKFRRKIISKRAFGKYIFILWIVGLISPKGFGQSVPELINPYFGTQSLRDIGFLNETQGYLVGTNHTYQTTDGGNTWYEEPGLSGGERIEIQGQLTVIMTDTELVSSVNGGDTWNVVYTAPESGNITDFCIAADLTMYLVSDEGLLRSENGGLSWTIIDPEVNFVQLHFFDLNSGIASGFDGIIYRTVNGGETWEAVYDNPDIYFVIADFDFPTNMVGYGCSQYGILKTIDGGASWFELAVPDLTFYSVAFADEQTGVISDAYGTVIRTENGGDTWDAIELDDVGWSHSRVEFGGDDRFHAVGMWNQIFDSLDLGVSWQRETCPVEDVMAFDPYNSERIYILGQNHLVAINSGGEPCEILSENLSVWTNSKRDIEMITESLGYAIIEDGLLNRTTDGGANWEQVNFGPDNVCDSGKDLAFANGMLYLSAECGNRFYYSSDFGYTWTMSDNNIWVGQVHPHTESIIYVYPYGVGGFGPSTIYKSMDGGATWGNIDIPETPLRSAFFVNENVGYAGCGNDFYKTTDGGITWTLSPEPNDGGFTTYNDIAFIDENRGWIIDQGTQVYETIDGGNTWIEYDTGNFFMRELEQFENTIYVAGYSGVMYKKTFTGVVSAAPANTGRTSFTVYPNPVNDNTFVLDLPSGDAGKFNQLIIMDLQGRIVQAQNLTGNMEPQVIAVDGSLSNGIYLIQLMGKSKSQVQKLVLRR